MGWGGISNTTIISLAFYHSECTKNLFQVHTTNMFPQSTRVFTSVKKLPKKSFRLQLNKFIMFVEIGQQFANVLTLFRCFLPNVHCSHDSSLHYWFYCHITNKETLPASDEQMLDASEETNGWLNFVKKIMNCCCH